MKKLQYLILFIVLVAVLSACSASNTTTNTAKEVLDAEMILPEEILLNQATNLEVRVTQGEEAVEDATQVQFAIWRMNSEGTSTMIEAKHDQDGIYRVSYTFQEDGIYNIQTHVSARSQHVMPTKQIIVGNVSEEELNSIQEEPTTQEQDSHHGHH